MDPRSTLLAPAKINLRLKVTGRRSDGYHLLDMVMVRLGLADTIGLELTDAADSFEWDSTVITAGGGGTRSDLPLGPGNTIWKAADLVRRESGKKFGLQVQLKKVIPVAAGLGGGSSDAAAVLKVLNERLHLGWDLARLIELGVQIGADVPFFLAPDPAQKVTGIGERLEAFSLLPLPLVLINPGFPVSTADAYRWYDARWGPSGESGISPDSSEHLALPVRARLTRQKGGASLPPLPGVPPLENDLEEVVIPRYPVLGRLKDLLSDAGALGALMSGSGPTVFGIFKSTESRDQGYDILLREKDPRWWVWKGQTAG